MEMPEILWLKKRMDPTLFAQCRLQGNWRQHTLLLFDYVQVRLCFRQKAGSRTPLSAVVLVNSLMVITGSI